MLALFLGCCLLAGPDDRPDIVLADFEGTDYGDWVVTGEAFGTGPARGTLANQMPVDGYLGKGLVNTYLRGDGTTGTLTSPRFRIERDRVNFLIGGGRQPNTAFARLIIDGKTVVTSTGRNSEHLAWDSWDVRGYAGQFAHVEIVDEATGAWGHINVDQVVLSDRAPSAADERTTLLARANEAVRAAAADVAKDPDRPVFHFLPPARWMNDPNGPIYHQGYYHLFYQHNPYGDQWGNMHWGHARSRDLVRWEHRPIALWPSKAAGEDHVFSGCATMGPDGRPWAFYTSIGPRSPEQWLAVPEDDTLDLWKKHPANPVMTESLHGATRVHEWRDPFVFHHEGQTFVVLGGNLNGNKGGQAVVNVYQAREGDLTKWTYRGALFQHPDAAVKNIECPLFFPLDGKWVLIVSQGKPVDWFVGDLDGTTMRFTPKARGQADFGQFYAPNVLMNDPKGRRVLWGWMDGVPAGKGWRHCLTLPRVLSIGPDGHLRQAPLPELVALRGERRALVDVALANASRTLEWPAGDAFEVAAVIERGKAERVGLDVGASLSLGWHGRTMTVGDTRVPLELGEPERWEVRVFVDRAIAEVYVNGRACFSKFVKRPAGPFQVTASAEGGEAAVRSLECWAMGSIGLR